MSSKRRVGVAHFLLRTYEMLETQKLRHLIEWSPCGTYFYIKNARDFAHKILPQYFKHRNFQSFLRQLNMYNFIKKRLKNGWNQFQHKYFKRDAKHLLHKVHRRSNGQLSEQEEPDTALLLRHTDELKSVKTSHQSLYLTTQGLMMQQQLIREALVAVKTKLCYQIIEEQKQEQYLLHILSQLNLDSQNDTQNQSTIASPKLGQTILAGNPKSCPQDPQLFVLS